MKSSIPGKETIPAKAGEKIRCKMKLSTDEDSTVPIKAGEEVAAAMEEVKNPIKTPK